MTNPDQVNTATLNLEERNSALENVRLFLASHAERHGENAEYQPCLDASAHHLNDCFSILKATFESSLSGIVALNVDGFVICMNTVFLEMWHLPTNSLRQPNTRIIKDQIANQSSEFIHFLERLNPHSINPMAPTKQVLHCFDGRTIDVCVSPQISNGTSVGFVLTCQDITNSQYRSEKSSIYQQQIQSLEQAINTHEILSIADAHGLIIHVNDMFCEVSGYSREELIGQDHKIVNSGHHPREFFRDLWLTISQGKVWRAEVCNRSKSGKLYWVDSTVVPLMDSTGKPVQYISIRLEITQRKEAEQALIKAKQKAEETLAFKEAFLASMSHEIRTPLNAIIGMTYLVMKAENNPKQLDYLEKIQFSGEHLLKIIDRILTFSKLSAGKVEIEEIEFNFKELLANFSALISNKVIEKGLQLCVEVPPQLQKNLRGDPQRILEILVNYASNAIKFTERGSITLRILLLKETPDSALVRFEVQDTGIGLSTEALAKLFQAFQQADASITRKYGGTGLGLAICKQLVELMQGEVGVVSTIGQGSTFWFQLPLAQCKPTVALPVVPPIRKEWAKHTFDGIHILVAEDSDFNQMVIINLLEMVGAKVTVANNGQESLEALSKTHFDCVLMDLQMPVMDGLEATRLIRADAALCKTLIIALSANAYDDDRERCKQAGMNDFLSKPIEPALLYTMLEQWLLQARTQEPITISTSHETSPAPISQQIELQSSDNVGTIDLTLLHNVVKGDKQLVKKLMFEFLDAAQLGLSEIETALLHQDIPALNLVGLRLKSSARTLGAFRLSDLCAKLENIDNNTPLKLATTIFSEIQIEFEKVNAEILAQFQLTPLTQTDIELNKLRVMLIDGESTQLHHVKDMLLSIGVSHLVCETDATHSLTVLHNQTFDVIFYKLSPEDMTYEDYMGELAECEFSGSVALLPDFNSKVFNNVPTHNEINKVHFLGLIDQPINEEKLVQLLSRVRKLKTHIQE